MAREKEETIWDGHSATIVSVQQKMFSSASNEIFKQLAEESQKNEFGPQPRYVQSQQHLLPSQMHQLHQVPLQPLPDQHVLMSYQNQNLVNAHQPFPYSADFYNHETVKSFKGGKLILLTNFIDI